MTETVTDNEGVVRRVPLSRIEPADGFNPRTARDPERFARLVTSIRSDGLLSPLLVTPTENGVFRLIAGEGRWLACGEAQITEVTVHVVAVDDKTGGLELAMAENLARQDLDPVEEARGFQRLRDAGLTKKGIAERLGLSQKRITERLELLKLPDGLHPQIACGVIPPAAVKPLLRVQAIHAELPGVLAARVAAPPAQSWMEPTTWTDVIDDPIGCLVADASGDATELPADVFDAGAEYAVERFSLDDDSTARLTELLALLDLDASGFRVRFGREAVEQAQALKAVHGAKGGYGALIVGQDVADQLAADHIAALLEHHRAYAARQAAMAGNDATPGGGEPDGPPDEQEVQARRRAEREAEQQARRAAHAHNLQLGAAMLKHLARLKVDADVLKIVTAVDVLGDLPAVAARGARYGFPGWTTETTAKSGKVKVAYLDKTAAGARAREFLAGASSPAEICGRLFSLIVMARYADEQAVARSQRSFASLTVGDGAPWADQTLGLIDELCAERLPEHLTEQVRAEQAERARLRAEREAEVAAARERLADIEQRAGQLDDEQRTQALADIDTVHGFSIDGHRLKTLLRDATPRDEAGADDALAA